MIYSVIGIGFGDEGKGITTDYLCSNQNIKYVARYSGGAQAGHTVYHNDEHHIFSHFGSGSFRKVPTVWMKKCPFDPLSCWIELLDLQRKDLSPTIYVDKRCPVVTPYDMWANSVDDSIRKDGTCGFGIRKTLLREEKLYSLTVGDLENLTVFELKLNLINKLYHGNNVSSVEKGAFIEDVLSIIGSSNVVFFDETDLHSDKVFKEGDVVLESSQGLLLDPNIGFFPHVTSTEISSEGITCSDQFYLVTRAYQTRHGNGPMTNQSIDDFVIKDDEQETNTLNTFQGEFRRSMLDLDLLKYGLDKSVIVKSKSTLVVTCLDHIDQYAFTYNGDVVHFDSEVSFVKGIAQRLGLPQDKILISKSPYSKNMEWI